ncbi:MAG: trypsin-like peptidase domain-containing protein [Pyrinomonadaceae bacterium]|nr:trypsin-like peptidase domain-containing protein [Pyrinomonadaceae bacterium]
MANGLVIHIEVGSDKHTEVLMQDRIKIGSSEESDLRLHASLLPFAPGTLLELSRANGHYRVGDFNRSVPITHNDRPIIAGALIESGDEIEVVSTDLVLQFFPVGASPTTLAQTTQSPAHVAPFIEHAAIEAAATARRDDAKIFLREFTRELVREINPVTKIITLLIALSLVGGVLYFGFATYKEIKESRRRIQEQNEHLARVQEQLKRTGIQIDSIDEVNNNILSSFSLAPQLRSQYGNGVCMIAGSYIFVEANTNRPLRYPDPTSTTTTTTEENPPVPATADAGDMLTAEGSGAIYERPFVGTGFHVGNGYVLTNWHVVVQPWAADERAQYLSASVSGRPKLKSLVAYFPNQRQPTSLRIRTSSQRDDIAVCQLDPKTTPANLPVLPLDADSNPLRIGTNVVMISYISGPDRLLATLPEAESRVLQERYGASLESLLTQLAARGYIKPILTQGNITDLNPQRIINSAANGEGASGAPLFGSTGRVIGVNFAIFTENAASNFAVPISFATRLLERAGWQQPKPQVTNTNTNTNTRDARPDTVQRNSSN